MHHIHRFVEVWPLPADESYCMFFSSEENVLRARSHRQTIIFTDYMKGRIITPPFSPLAHKILSNQTPYNNRSPTATFST